MIKIRPLGARDLRQVLQLLERYRQTQACVVAVPPPPAGVQDLDQAALTTLRQLYVPVHKLSQWLPPGWQFVQAIFVASARHGNRHKVLGLIGLSPDGRGNHRWKIDQLIIDPDESTYDVGTQLVQYVVNRYGGEGVQTFLALVDSNYVQTLGLFKACGFRRNTGQVTLQWGLSREANAMPGPIVLPRGLRLSEGGTSDAQRLQALYLDALSPETKPCLARSTRDFTRPLSYRVLDHLRGVYHRRWVVEDLSRDLLVGAMTLRSPNYQDFTLSLMLSTGWMGHLPDMLDVVRVATLQTYRQARLHCALYTHQTLLLEGLQQHGWSASGEAQVLVKDYWIPLHHKRLASPILLFARGGQTSPA
jgi:ribosomal protein S18 acetylase RimI-like enzyme